MTSALQRFKDAAKDSGDLFLPQTARQFLYTHIIGSDSSMFYISYWSIMHMLSGIATGLVLLVFFNKTPYYFTGVLVHTLWELWQKFIGMTKWDLRGAIDTVMDTIMHLIGMAIIAAVNTKMI
jgi:hypothetical protein